MVCNFHSIFCTIVACISLSQQSPLSVSAIQLSSSSRASITTTSLPANALPSSQPSSSTPSLPPPRKPKINTTDNAVIAFKRRTAITKIAQFGAVLLLGDISTIAADPATKAVAMAETGSSISSSSSSISSRLRAESLTMPPLSGATDLTGFDNVYYPTWLEGQWNVTQTLTSTTTPLGLQYIGGPAGSVDIATKSLEEQNLQINVPITFQLRYVKSRIGNGKTQTVVLEDRVFNTKQRLDSFAGRKVVSSVEYADVGGSNRNAVLAAGGGQEDPLQTTVVRFRGPAAQKTFVLGHGVDGGAGSAGDDGGRKWTGYEVNRNIFMLTNQNTSPPITTDTELIWSFEKVEEDGNLVRGKLRIVSYLNSQQDQLYFQAKNRAVSIADYELTLLKLANA